MVKLSFSTTVMFCSSSVFHVVIGSCDLLACCVDSQAVEYEDISNETENQEYEEYETYEDGYGFAEREGEDTWDGEVELINHSVQLYSPRDC